MTEVFKLSGVGLDTTNLTYAIPFVEENFNYFYTNPSANNGLLIKDIINPIDDVKPRLIVGLDFLDMSGRAIGEHLNELGREVIDVLLIDAKCDFFTYKDEIKALVDNGLVKYLGIKNPEERSLDYLEKVREEFKISSIGLNICPLYFNVEVMDWAKANGLIIYGFNPMGGYYSTHLLIDCFSTPYLLNFAAHYCDVVMLSGRDITFSEVNKEYLDSLIGVEETDNYEIKKTVNKLAKPLKRVVNISLKVGEELFPIIEQDEVFNLNEFVLKFGAAKEVIDHYYVVDESDEVQGLIMSYLREAAIPKDAKDPKDFMACIRPVVYSLFEDTHPKKDGWSCHCAFVGSLFLFSAVREFRRHHIFFRDDIEIETSPHYLLYFSEDEGFVLRKLQK